ncbi:hypothetical protein QZH41_001955 [Actinostola sp. cb2023]|nr:hypothetical protein QZH41_001955 [Actinostola sp. cb2023]
MDAPQDRVISRMKNIVKKALASPLPSTAAEADEDLFACLSLWMEESPLATTSTLFEGKRVDDFVMACKRKEKDADEEIERKKLKREDNCLTPGINTVISRVGIKNVVFPQAQQKLHSNSLKYGLLKKWDPSLDKVGSRLGLLDIPPFQWGSQDPTIPGGISPYQPGSHHPSRDPTIPAGIIRHPSRDPRIPPSQPGSHYYQPGSHHYQPGSTMCPMQGISTIPYDLFPVPYDLFPVPYDLFPVPPIDLPIPSTYDLFPVPMTYSQYPMTYSQYPMTYSQYPMTYSQYPMTYSQYPMTYSQVPMTYSQYPMTYSQYPMTYSQYPMTYSQYPMTYSQYPMTYSQYPMTYSH